MTADRHRLTPVAYWEQQYNPRLAVPTAEEYFDRWRTRAAQARATLDSRLDVAYGHHERERLDIFRAESARGTLVFLHGGYWRAFSKNDFSWIAVPFVRAGITVVMPSYPLCPSVSLPRISASVEAAAHYIASEVLDAKELKHLVLAGHSAGAHLAACYASGAAAGNGSGVAPSSVVCISGLFDLLPLLRVPFLAGMEWDTSELFAASPLYRPVPACDKVIAAVGELESREFHRQSERLADAWAERCSGVVSVPAQNHFSVLDTAAEPEGTLSKLLLSLY